MRRKPTYAELEKSVEKLEPRGHLCCIYETEEEHRSLLTPFLRHGLGQREKVLYIVDDHTAEKILNYLRDDGLEVDSYLKNGQLRVLTVAEAYMKGGVFDPDSMIALLREENTRALDEGYTALRVTGEMSWALKGLPGSERFIEYESKLNDFFSNSKCIAICQYDRCKFEASLLLDVLITHPSVMIGTQTYDNFYYIPPKDYLGPFPEAAKLDNCLKTLLEHKRTEKVLQESEKRYRALVEDMPALMCRFSPDGTLSFVNNAYCRYFDRNREELVGENFFKFIPKQERKKIRTYFESLSEEMPVISYEHKVVAPNGEYRWQRWTERALFDEKGKLKQYQSIGRDITEQKQAEIALQEKEQKLERQTQNLEEVNTALKVLLEHREEEKKKSEENILANVKKLIFPYLEKLENSRLGDKNQIYIDIIRSDLKDLIAPFANKLYSKYSVLTPTEIQVADLIRHGKTSKEIASLLNVSLKAVSFHRGNIRKKLDLVNKKRNLKIPPTIPFYVEVTFQITSN